MSVLAILTDLLFIVGFGYVGVAGAVMSWLGLGFAGNTGIGAPAASFVGLAGVIGIIYYPHFIPHLFDLIPVPDWS